MKDESQTSALDSIAALKHCQYTPQELITHEYLRGVKYMSIRRLEND